jgi:hypothetical protein
MDQVRYIEEFRKECETNDYIPDDVLAEIPDDALELAHYLAGGEDNITTEEQYNRFVEESESGKSLSFEEFISIKRQHLEDSEREKKKAASNAGVVPPPVPSFVRGRDAHVPNKPLDQMQNLIRVKDPDAVPELEDMAKWELQIDASAELTPSREQLAASTSVSNIDQYLNQYELEKGFRHGAPLYSEAELEETFCQEMARYTLQAHSKRVSDEALYLCYFVEAGLFISCRFERVPGAEKALGPRHADWPREKLLRRRRYRWDGYRYLRALPRKEAPPAPESLEKETSTP